MFELFQLLHLRIKTDRERRHAVQNVPRISKTRIVNEWNYCFFSLVYLFIVYISFIFFSVQCVIVCPSVNLHFFSPSYTLNSPSLIDLICLTWSSLTRTHFSWCSTCCLCQTGASLGFYSAVSAVPLQHFKS